MKQDIERAIDSAKHLGAVLAVAIGWRRRSRWRVGLGRIADAAGHGDAADVEPGAAGKRGAQDGKDGEHAKGAGAWSGHGQYRYDSLTAPTFLLP